MTHILIPLTEEFKKAIDEAYLEDIYQGILNGKKISLNEKDIEEKAKLQYTEQSANPPYCSVENKRAIEGYKQALKDLL